MDENLELLNYIHQNAEMGQETLRKLINIVDDEAFRQHLESELNEYNSLYETSDMKISQVNKKAKNISVLTRVSTYLMINVKTLLDKSVSNIAQMLIQGSTKGIIEITKKLKEYQSSDQDIRDLGQRLLDFEQKNVEVLKMFL